ncbi:choice-of-anchor D domain-containing protein [Lacinutrix sp. WUR7]|uniref:choice-of-anchor D domain-containing protein n=1 Tax=Lacinutrix sp. WUR7 TaxID=2653681 RepID=UPI00193DC946|nr:choice-of-anchor D domain-containing protein [Lacinutrix sp. WUR7]QRM89975.1 choice-of-anchor D domain-containing protein [Lacinutrix sp. WUR7]
MKNITILVQKYLLLLTVLIFSSYSFSQDFNVQHLQDDVSRSGDTNTSFTAVSSLNNAVALANNNRKTNAGQNGNGGNLSSDDVAGARVLTGTNTLSYYRESSSSTSNMRFNTSIWDYIGTAGGDNEMIVRGRYTVNLNGGTNSATQAISGITNAEKCIPFITGILNNATSEDADSGTAIAYLQNSNTLNVLKGSNNNNVTVYITLVEFTGVNWTVLHGDSGNKSADTGTITLRDNANGTGTATNVSDWDEAIIFSHHIGDTGASGSNDAISDNWPIMDPGNNRQRVDWEFDANHDSAGTNRQFVHVLSNADLNVTRYQNTANTAGETTINITSAGLTNTNQALIVGSSRSSGGGAAYARGWRNYYLKSTTQAAHWSHRSGNTMAHEIQIIDLAGLTSTPPTPTYCASNGTNSFRTGTRLVDFNTINNATPREYNDYSDFTSISTTVNQGNSYDLTVNANTDGNYTTYTNVWIDWNQDYDFDDAGESYYLGTASNTNNGATSLSPLSITIPLSAALGNIRMRVSTKFGSSANSCDTGFDGEVEDYTINVIANTPQPEINITGLGNTINDGDTTPVIADDTEFGTVETGSTSDHTFTIHNTGTLPLNLTGGSALVDITGNAAFTILTQPGGNTIAAGSSRTFVVRFAPTVGGIVTANISIDNDDSNENPYNFRVQGTGHVPAPEINITGNGNTINDGDTTPVASDDTEFGSIGTGLTLDHTFTIHNTGTLPLNLTGGSPLIDITGNAAFTILTPPSGNTIAVGSSSTFVVRFAPTVGGTVTADISIDNDDSNENPYNFRIQGTGNAPEPEINIVGNGNNINDGDSTPSTSDFTEFGDTFTENTIVRTFTIENSGTATLNITSVTSSNGIFSILTPPATTVAPGSSTTFTVQFAPTSAGTITSIITVNNNDSNENTYTFTVEGVANSVPPLYTAYYENFDANNGAWTNVTTTNDSWVWTDSFTTTDEMAEGSFWRNSSYANYNNNTDIEIQSPIINLSGLKDLKFSIDLKYNTQNNTDGMRILYSINNGAFTTLGSSGDGTKWYQDNVTALGSDGWNDDGHTANPAFNPHSQFERASIELSNATFSNIANVRFKVQFKSNGSSTREGVAFDNVLIEANPITALSDASIAPANITNNLRLWLKSNVGITATDGNKLTNWEDQAYDTNLDKEDAYASTALAPTFRDNGSRNMNYNPVADFNHNNLEYMQGKGGYFAQDYYAVFRSDDEIATDTGDLSPGREFVIGGRFSDEAYHEDATGLGMGSTSARYDNEILSHTISSFPQSGSPNETSYGRSYSTTSDTYSNHPLIVNVKTNAAGTSTEIYKNGKRIDNTTGKAGSGDDLNFNEFNNLQYLLGIGRSSIAGRTSSQMNGMITEIISYTSPNSAISQQKIQSYLAVKYGVTLQDDASTLSDHRLNDANYIDSQGNVIWNTSTNSGHNYDIAGIGRDDASLLDQRQSRSQNDEADGIGPTSGFLTMALTSTHETNNENIANTTALANRQFLMWGNNNADINGAAMNITVDMSANIADASLTTEVSFTAIPRIWKVVEVNGDIPRVEVSIPVNSVRTATPPDGNYLMFISQTGVFDPTADYRVMKEVGGKLYADYDFDGTEYITFGWAPERTFKRSIYFNPSDQNYVDIEDNLDLDPTGFTVSAWINKKAGSNNKSILSKRNEKIIVLGYTEGYDFKINSIGRFEMSWYNASGIKQSLTSSVAIPNNEWHQLAVIYDGTKATLYIDGVADTSANKSAPIDTNHSFFIGAAAKNTPEDFFNGNIDEVRVWNTALTENQLRFIMNQEIDDNASFSAGKYFVDNSIHPTKNDIAVIPWNDLEGYYPMSTYTYTNTKDNSGKGHQGALKNLRTVDHQTAPLPYMSNANGDWNTNATWLNGNVQTIPGTASLVDNTKTVDWNIVVTNHNVTMDNASLPSANNENRSVLGLFVDANKLTVNGDNTSSTGNGLTVSHFLNLDGKIDLQGESQLIQTEDSDLNVTSAGTLEKDQQGTEDYFTYNYWSSPVGVSNTTSNNNSYTLNDNIFKDGSNPLAPVNMNFVSGYNGSNGTPIGIAHYWIWKFSNRTSQDYASWQHIRNTGSLLPGEGFTMKGVANTGENVSLQQNYTIEGKPNNGDITLNINAGNDYLIGNPYASAMDADTFILANTNTTGSIYYWEHFGGGTHNTIEYQGGYAVYNLAGGVAALQYDYTTGGSDLSGGTGLKEPGRYIPVAQGFFVIGESNGTIDFKNNQRAFQKEGASSVFIRTSQDTANRTTNNEVDDRLKMRISFNTSNTYKRQLLVTRDDRATNLIDFGFDAINKDDQSADMFWMIEDEKFVIQGTNTVNESTILPLGIKTNVSGINTFKIDALINFPEDLQIYVHDKTLDTYSNLRNGDFEIDLPAGAYLDRFEITFTDQALSIEESEIYNLEAYFANDIDSMIINNPKNIQIDQAKIINMLGQEVYSYDEATNESYIALKTKNLSSGAYIITLKTEIGKISKKVLVK